jgi:VanZ family protein
MKINNNVYKYLFIVWTIILFTLTSCPSLHTPSMPIGFADKIAHFVFYLIFALLFAQMKKHQSYEKTLKQLCILALIVPLLDELHQIPIPGRQFSIYDIFADIFGMSIVIGYYYIKSLRSNAFQRDN